VSVLKTDVWGDSDVEVVDKSLVNQRASVCLFRMFVLGGMLGLELFVLHVKVGFIVVRASSIMCTS
jgi:hypothetical protein